MAEFLGADDCERAVMIATRVLVGAAEHHHDVQAWLDDAAGGPVFFADRPERAPALNKVPLVRWDRRYAYVSSTHMLLPRGLNAVFDEWGGEKASGGRCSTMRGSARHCDRIARRP